MLPCATGAAISADAESAFLARQQIENLEWVMRQMPQIEVPVRETFGPGFYARTISIAAGTTLVGKVHATEHVFIVSKGSIELVSEDGRLTVEAPYQTVCRPGLKRVGFALTNVECTNVHITDETDPTKLEAALILAPALAEPERVEALQ